MSHRDDRLDDRLIVLAFRNAAHEGLVDLHTVERETFQVGQRRVAGTEVVHRQVESQPFQFVQHFLRVLLVAHHRAFGDFQLERLGRQAGFPDGFGNELNQALVRHLSRGNVDRDTQLRQAALLPGAILHTGRLRDPAAHRHDQAGFLRDGDEISGRHEPELRAYPAYQGLQAGDPTGCDIDLRLVVQHEFVVVQRVAQVRFEFQPLHRMRVQLLGIELERASAFFLGAIHCDVRILQQRLGIASVRRIGTDADARRGTILPSGENHRLGQRFQNLAGHRAGLVLGAQPFCQHREFIAAEARDHVDFPDTGDQPFRHYAQYLVARVVAQTVVDVLETVEVEKQDRQHLATALGALQRLVQHLPELATVRQFGQFVVVGEETGALFLLLAFGDVLQHTVHPARGAVFGARYMASRKDVRDLLVSAHEPELVAPVVRGGFDGAEKLLLHARAVVRMDVFEPGRHVVGGLLVAASEHLRIIVAAPQLVVGEVPIEHGIIGRLRSEVEAFEVTPHHLTRMIAAGDVPGDDHARLLPRKLHAERNHLDIDRRAVLPSVAPRAHLA